MLDLAAGKAATVRNLEVIGTLPVKPNLDTGKIEVGKSHNS